MGSVFAMVRYTNSLLLLFLYLSDTSNRLPRSHCHAAKRSESIDNSWWRHTAGSRDSPPGAQETSAGWSESSPARTTVYLSAAVLLPQDLQTISLSVRPLGYKTRVTLAGPPGVVLLLVQYTTRWTKKSGHVT